MEYIAGIDVGGTFTDVLLRNENSGQLRLAKVLSTPNQAEGLLAGLRQFDAPLDRLAAVVHGTTVATNAVLERKGSRAALVTTRGFRDVLELRRRDRPTTYGLTGSYTPLIPRSRCFEVTERIDADGTVRVPLTDAEITALAGRLRGADIESVAVCLLHSYTNPVHERRLVDGLRELGIPVAASAEICPEPGEFERASTTAVNAYVRATMSRYLGAVQEELNAAGFGREVAVMQSNGGLMPAGRAGEYAVRTVLSGPAAGTVAAAAFGQAAGLPDVISCDMGGTSFDVALIPGGRPAVTAESSIEYGIPIRVPMVDIKTIGAGGGSIARVDRAGILQVGPESAGSVPGPACYRRGGTEPTVTDANVVLGRIAGGQRLGTERDFVLDADAAAAVIRERIADPLGLDLPTAALAIVRVANEKLAAAVRTVSVDRGHDPRRFALVGFGGAGPLHVAELAAILGAGTVLVPPHPGALSAYGCLIADAKYDYVTAVNCAVTDCAPAETLARQRELGIKALAADGADPAGTVVEHAADMHYGKQLHTIRVPLGDREEWTADALADRFREQYAATYGSRTPAGAILVANLRTEVTGLRPAATSVLAADTDPPADRHRPVRFADGDHHTPVLHRSRLRAGEVRTGPMVVEQSDCTILLPPRCTMTVHPGGSLIIEVSQ